MGDSWVLHLVRMVLGSEIQPDVRLAETPEGINGRVLQREPMSIFLFIWTVIGAAVLTAFLHTTENTRNLSLKQEALIIFFSGPAVWLGVAVIFIRDHLRKKLK